MTPRVPQLSQKPGIILDSVLLAKYVSHVPTSAHGHLIHLVQAAVCHPGPGPLQQLPLTLVRCQPIHQETAKVTILKCNSGPKGSEQRASQRHRANAMVTMKDRGNPGSWQMDCEELMGHNVAAEGAGWGLGSSPVPGIAFERVRTGSGEGWRRGDFCCYKPYKPFGFLKCSCT